MDEDKLNQMQIQVSVYDMDAITKDLVGLFYIDALKAELPTR